MTKPKMDVEHTARGFPSPQGSRPARSLTYRCGGHIYRAVIGQPRRRCDELGGAASHGKPAVRTRSVSGSTVLSIVATQAAVEIWSREPASDWPNPSLVAHGAVLNIDYLDSADVAAS